MRSDICLDANTVVRCRSKCVVPLVQPLKACQGEPSIRGLQLLCLSFSPGKQFAPPVRLGCRGGLGNSTRIADPEKKRCDGHRSTVHPSKNSTLAHASALGANRPRKACEFVRS